MKRLALFALSVLAVSTSAFAQSSGDNNFDRALAAAPRQMREGATVVKWNPDFTYETLKKGTNRLVCYDQSGLPTEQPFSSQCTSIGNLERVAQNRRFEATIADRAERQKAIEAAEANGTRVKPEFGSVFYTFAGADQASARMHMTIAVPGATAQSLGLPDNPKTGGAWIMNAGTSTAHIMVPGS
jgi:hypothetical protein